MSIITATPTNSNVSVGNTSTEVIAGSSGRQMLMLSNDSDETIYLAVGAAAVLNKGIRLNANGGSVTFEANSLIGPVLTKTINAICTTGTKNLCIFEVTV